LFLGLCTHIKPIVGPYELRCISRTRLTSREPARGKLQHPGLRWLPMAARHCEQVLLLAPLPIDHRLAGVSRFYGGVNHACVPTRSGALKSTLHVVVLNKNAPPDTL
jgi:hypothetical protein